MPDAPSILETIAQDLNRSLLHGGRQTDSAGKTLPSAVLTGRQAPTDETKLVAGVQILVKDLPAGAPLIALPAKVAELYKAATDALQTPGQPGKPFGPEGNAYFKLDEDRSIPQWIFHQRTLSLPEVRDVNSVRSGDQTVQRLSAAILREIESDNSILAEASLCEVKEETVEGTQAKRSYLDPISADKWAPGLLLRCRVTPQGETPALFELQAIPQEERWYLDQLGLLREGVQRKKLPADTSLELFLEWQDAGNANLSRNQILEWTLVRRNLTGLARPGEISTEEDASPPLPLTTAGDVEKTLQLFQMASITNSGGYFFRAVKTARPIAGLPAEVYITVSVRMISGVPPAFSQILPLYANAIAFKHDVKLPRMLRFEGKNHVVIEPFAPPGSISFGWRRPAPAGDLVDTPAGFARMIHLVDYEIRDKNGDLAQSWSEVIKPGNPPTVEFFSESCSADTGPALSPVKPIAGEKNAGTEEASDQSALSLDSLAHPFPKGGAEAEEEFFYYRTTVRFARQHLFKRIGAGGSGTFVIASGFRDIFGNRIAPGFKSQEKILSYTDPLVAPGEWPGVTLRLIPQEGRKATFVAEFAGTSGGDPISNAKKFALIYEQLEGRGLADGIDVAVTLEFPSPIKAAVVNKPLRQLLLEFFAALAKGQQASPETPFRGETEIRIENLEQLKVPTPFQPRLKIERKDFIPPELPATDPADARLFRKIVRQQVSTALGEIQLALPPAPTPRTDVKPIPEFEKIAQAVEDRWGAGFHAGVRRNRFSEAELWIIPDAALPKPRSDTPRFGSPRPLSTKLGADEFLVPDFSKPGPAKGKAKFARVDFDLTARRVFDFIESSLNPLDITNPDEMAFWDKILAAKREIGETLGTPSQTYILPIHRGAHIDAPGIRRMAVDGMQRSLAEFYSLDTIVQFPIALPAQNGGINNYYGKLDAKVGGRENAGFYSDFVLSSTEDTAGWLTTLYDLAPGEEGNWDAWKTAEPVAVISHIQLSAPNEPPTHEFDRGQWIKFVRPIRVPLQPIGVELAVPVAIRRFPAEPMFKACQQAKALESPTLEQLSLWQWEISFVAEKSVAVNDIVYLDIDYNLPELAPPGKQTEDDEWPANLLQALLVLNELATRWTALRTGSEIGARRQALDWLANLSTAMARRLKNSAIEAAEADDTRDHFELKVGVTGRLDAPANIRVKKVWVQMADVPDLQGMTQISLGLDPIPPQDAQGNPIPPEFLNLFGPANARNFRPSLRLKRNKKIGDTDANDEFIYECGPVLWPNPAPVANRWSQTIVVPTGSNLRSSIEAALAKIFGGQNLVGIGLLIHMRHVFGEARLIANPFSMAPISDAFKTVANVADAVTKAYMIRLGGEKADSLLPTFAQRNGKFQLSIQTSPLTGSGRIWLEIANLEFDLRSVKTLGAPK